MCVVGGWELIKKQIYTQQHKKMQNYPACKEFKEKNALLEASTGSENRRSNFRTNASNEYPYLFCGEKRKTVIWILFFHETKVVAILMSTTTYVFVEK